MKIFPKVFKENKNSISRNILIIGGGRWSRVYISEIHKYFLYINNIYVLTKYKLSLNKWLKKKKISKVKVLNNEKFLKEIDFNCSIIANKNKDHYRYTKKMILLKKNVLVEKPFVSNKKLIKKLIYISNKNKINFFLSLPFFFSKYFYYIKEKIIKNKNVIGLEIEWHDKKNEIRYGQIKKHDNKINYLHDIFYHIYCILVIFFGNGRIIFNKLHKKKEFSLVKLQFNNYSVDINYKKKSIKRKRILKFILSNKKKIIVNFSNEKKIKIDFMNRKFFLPKKVSQTTLKYQVFYYLKSKFYTSKKSFLNFRNLNNLFKSIELIKKII